MNDSSKLPGEGEFKDTFSEDFDFGEGESVTETPTETKTASKTAIAPNKTVLGLVVFGIIFAVIGTIGYKFYKSPKKGETVAATPTPTTVAGGIAVPGTPAGAAKAPPSENFGEIEKAFSTAEVAPGAESVTGAGATAPGVHAPGPQIHPGGPGKLATGASIQELQKELFSPEAKAKAAAPSAPPPPAANAQEITQLNQGLVKLNQQIDYVLNKIKYLDSYTQEVNLNLNKLNESLQTMDNRISTLTNTTSTLSKDVGSVRNEVGHVRQVLREDGLDISTGSAYGKRNMANGGKVLIEEPEYVVHAVIPGRAWLKSTKGQIITVAEGDTVGNYGKILVIDAANGVVLTSSGVTFH